VGDKGDRFDSVLQILQESVGGLISLDSSRRWRTAVDEKVTACPADLQEKRSVFGVVDQEWFRAAGEWVRTRFQYLRLAFWPTSE